jgi:predicted Zn-dependent peptidase
MLKTFSLSNGLRVASYALPKKYSVYVSLSVRCGSLYESPEESGLAHFLEHILAEGIPSLPTASEISSFIEDRAGRYNLTTSRQRINFWVSLSKDSLEDALRIAKELFFEPLFEQRAIDKEKDAVFHEIRSKMDQEFYKFWVFWKKNRFIADNPLQTMTVGSIETVRNLTRDRLIEFWKKYFTINNCSLTVTGGFDDSHLQEKVMAIFGTLPKGVETERITLSPDLLSNKQAVFDKRDDLGNNRLNLSWGSIGFDKSLRKQYSLADMASRALANMASSRLHRKLRSESGLVYSVSMSHERYQGLGFSEIESRVSTENLPIVSKIITEEVANIHKNGLTEGEFKRLLKYKIDRSLMALDHPGAMADWIEDELFSQDEIEMPKEYATRIKKLKRDEVLSHLKNYWDLGKTNLLVQGPAQASTSEILNDALAVFD